MPQKQSHCFVPSTTGYKSCKKKLSLFGVPKDPSVLAQWRRAIPRADKQLEENSAVCELHFDERYISRHFEHTVNGEVVLIDRGRPLLRPGAVPTQFPNLPKYLSKPLAPSRKCQARSAPAAPPSKKSAEDHASPASAEFEEPSCSFSIENLTLPSTSWGKHTLSVSPLTVAYSMCLTAQDKRVLFADKLVLLSLEVGCVTHEVFVKGVKQHDVACDDPTLLLARVDAMSICSGAGTVNEFPFVIGNNKVLLQDMAISSQKCQGVSNESKPCIACKHLRKALLNQKSRRRRSQNKAARISKRRRTLAQTTRRLKAKLSLYTKTIQKMKEQSIELEESVLGERLEALPPKQRLAIMQCFRAARRKSVKGMKYNPDWLLECMIMRMKSPRLYEHVRREGILMLPSRTCLKVYMRRYKIGFGFNSAILAGIARKTKSMDEFKCHGGLIVDEMKLSECLNVGAGGKVEGLVDLGKFTPESDKHLPCDHGLVIMFQPVTGSWHQIFGVFASRGNVKAALLAKILLEAVPMGLHGIAQCGAFLVYPAPRRP